MNTPAFNGEISVLIILTNQNDQKTRNFQSFVPYDTVSRELKLNEVLESCSQRGISLNQAQIFHVDYVNRMKAFLGSFPSEENLKIGLESVVNGKIQLSYKKNQIEGEMVDESEEQIQVQIREAKPKKVKERTIVEAMEAVKQWRILYDTADESGKRIYTLEESAKIVGIAKKTLDDYHIHLRVAYQFNFNLDRYREQKVGILRKFVKLAREQGAEAVQHLMPECVLDYDTDKYWVDFDNI